jgi:Holliday junction DNA helicase RuvA
MIARLKGKLVEVEPARVVLDVSGVGYQITTLSSAGLVNGEEASFYTYLAVRETALDLYGFKDKEELAAFVGLLKIPKIGPKTAIQSLSKTDLPTLKKAIATEDPTYLTKMSGITKKSAEKIVAGLKDVFGDIILDDGGEDKHDRDSDVVDALITLGYPQRDALQALQNVPKDIEGTNERIKYALKELNQ